ncbi:hypothetical protein [Deinococcus sonorensis]|uniref:Uncharacterized protein n=2 Tax=Deinococcus sonorensis TaxID=309891 RepID=A0AAU7U5E6_9DEIO
MYTSSYWIFFLVLLSFISTSKADGSSSPASDLRDHYSVNDLDLRLEYAAGVFRGLKAGKVIWQTQDTAACSSFISEKSGGFVKMASHLYAINCHADGAGGLTDVVVLIDSTNGSIVYLAGKTIGNYKGSIYTYSAQNKNISDDRLYFPKFADTVITAYDLNGKTKSFYRISIKKKLDNCISQYSDFVYPSLVSFSSGKLTFDFKTENCMFSIANSLGSTDYILKNITNDQRK